MATTYLTWTPSQNGTRTKFTTSFWVKRSGLSSGQSPIFSSDISDSNDTYSMMYFVNDVLAFYSKDNTTTLYFLTNQKFRDVNGWYHIVITFDTTQTTASNRVKFYVNGEQITSFDTATYPPLDADNTWFNRNWEHVIGRRSYDGATYFDGSLSHFNFIDGTAYDASAFGSTDSTTGEWVITTNPSVTYGTNGFFILKDGNSVTDQSGNSNNWTVGGGTLTKTEDNPSNVFATLNPLNQISSVSYTNGNNTFTNSTGTGNRLAFPTLDMPSGKFYCEMKVVTLGSNFTHIGLRNIGSYTLTNAYVNDPTNEKVSYVNDGRIFTHGGTTSSGNPTFTSGDIIGMACDMDNGYLYYHKNGTYVNSGSPTSGASGTGGFDIYNHASIDYCFAVSNSGDSSPPVISANFGNGYFGATAVSSAGTNASNNGIFEYDVPTGYTALSTK